jgi:hypothetical protein
MSSGPFASAVRVAREVVCAAVTVWSILAVRAKCGPRGRSIGSDRRSNEVASTLVCEAAKRVNAYAQEAGEGRPHIRCR